jgi:hypothetical protein
VGNESSSYPFTHVFYRSRVLYSFSLLELDGCLLIRHPQGVFLSHHQSVRASGPPATAAVPAPGQSGSGNMFPVGRPTVESPGSGYWQKGL